jgi:hypothetical protein
MRNSYEILVEKPEGKRPSGTFRHRWKDTMKMDLRGMGCEGAEWIYIRIRIRLVASSRQHGNESSGSIKRREFLDQLIEY